MKDPKAVAFLLGAAKKPPAEDAGEEEGGGGERAAAAGILAAIESKDEAALASELRNFVELCKGSYPEE